MKKTIAFILSAVLGLSMAGNAFAQDARTKIQTANAGISSIEFGFNHTKTLATKAVVQMSGTGFYNSDNRMALIYKEPASDKFIVNGNKMYLSRSGKSQTFDLAKVPSMRSLAYCVLYAVAGRLDDLASESNMDCSVEESKDSYIIKFTARQKAVKGYSSIVLTYRKSDCVVSRIEMEEFNHVLNVYVPSYTKLNQTIYSTVYNIPVQ